MTQTNAVKCVLNTGLLLALMMVATAAVGADWPGFLGPNRDGHSPDTGLLRQWPENGPSLIWKIDDVGPGWSSVALSNDRLYTTGNAGEKQMLICLNLDGEELWRVAQGPKCSHRNYSGARSTPTIDGNRIYWSFREAWRNTDLNCHPGNYVVADGKVFGKGKGGFVCVDLRSGETRWKERVRGGQVCWGDGMLYVLADSGGRVTLVDPTAEEARIKGGFSVDGEGRSWAHPVVIDGRLLIRYDTNLYCFDVKAP